LWRRSAVFRISAVRQLEIDQVGGSPGASREVGATASSRADENAVVWSFDRQMFDQLTKTQAALTPELVEHALRIQAEGLSFATPQIAALQRS
jgi:hypothetical protein